MRACLALCVVSALVGAALADCTACIGGQCYRKHSLPTAGELGGILDIDRNRNILYTVDGITLRRCELDTHICHNRTDESWIVEWLAVDQGTGDVYVRLDNYTDSYNLFKLDSVNNEKKSLIGEVWYMIFKDKLYYAPSASKGLYTYENGESRVVPGTEDYSVLTFVVDNKNDIYFKVQSNNDYFIKRLSNGVVDQSVNWDDFYWIRADKDDNAVFIHQQTHVVYKATEGRLVEVGGINDKIYHSDFFETPVFDKDNSIIYRHNSEDYFHLKRDDAANCVYTVSQNAMVITEVNK